MIGSIIYFTYTEIRLLVKLKIQWCIIICSWIGLGVYIWRFYQVSQIQKFFHQTNGYQYLNIQHVVFIDQILLFYFAFSCFFSTMKYIRKDLFYLLFYLKTGSCSDIFRTNEMLFEMLLLKFDGKDLC